MLFTCDFLTSFMHLRSTSNKKLLFFRAKPGRAGLGVSHHSVKYGMRLRERSSLCKPAETLDKAYATTRGHGKESSAPASPSPLCAPCSPSRPATGADFLWRGGPECDIDTLSQRAKHSARPPYASTALLMATSKASSLRSVSTSMLRNKPSRRGMNSLTRPRSPCGRLR